MCHAGRIKLSPEETKAVKKFYGTMAPVYASIALLIAGGVIASSALRQGGTLLAKNSAPAVASVNPVMAAD